MSKEELNTVLELISGRNDEEQGDKPVWQQRGEMELAGLAMPMPETAFDITQVRANGVPGLKIIPEGAPQDKVLLYFHGGGYICGSPVSHRHLVTRLAVDAGITAWSMDYRLAPEHPYPAAVDDAVAAYRYLVEEEGIAPDNIVLGGDSAGGGLSLALLLALKASALPLPGGAILLSPWTDLTASGKSYETRAQEDKMLKRDRILQMADAYVSERDRKEPTVSPLFGDLSGLPPLYIHVGDAEVLLDDSLALTEQARNAGVHVDLTVYPDMIHVWQFFWPILSEGRESCQKLAESCRRILFK